MYGYHAFPPPYPLYRPYGRRPSGRYPGPYPQGGLQEWAFSPSRFLAATLIGRRVINAGIPGEVTAHALERLPAALDEYSPRLLLLCIGGNDFLRQLGKRQAAANVREMVRLAKARQIDVVLIGTAEPGLTVTPPEFYAEIAKQFAVPYQGKAIGYVLRHPELKSDPIHPNAKGYRLIAERLAELLRERGALAPGN